MQKYIKFNERLHNWKRIDCLLEHRVGNNEIEKNTSWLKYHESYKSRSDTGLITSQSVKVIFLIIVSPSPNGNSIYPQRRGLYFSHNRVDTRYTWLSSPWCVSPTRTGGNEHGSDRLHDRLRKRDATTANTSTRNGGKSYFSGVEIRDTFLFPWNDRPGVHIRHHPRRRATLPDQTGQTWKWSLKLSVKSGRLLYMATKIIDSPSTHVTERFLLRARMCVIARASLLRSRKQ